MELSNLTRSIRVQWLWWQRGQRGLVDLEEEGDDKDNEEAEAAFAVLVEQGWEVAAEASRPPNRTNSDPVRHLPWG